jgi:hypothetical protein
MVKPTPHRPSPSKQGSVQTLAVNAAEDQVRKGPGGSYTFELHNSAGC